VAVSICHTPVAAAEARRDGLRRSTVLVASVQARGKLAQDVRL